MHSSRHNGFTLLEVLVALGVFLLFIGAVIMLYRNSFTSENIIFQQLDAQGEARRALQAFTNEIRSANYSSIGAYPIESATTTQVVFYANINSSTLMERVRYFFSGGTLQKGVTEPTGNPYSYVTSTETITPVVHYVVNTTTPVFTFYDQNYSGTSSALSLPINVSQVRMIGVTLQIDRHPSSSPAMLVVTTKTALRNLKSN